MASSPARASQTHSTGELTAAPVAPAFAVSPRSARSVVAAARARARFVLTRAKPRALKNLCASPNRHFAGQRRAKTVCAASAGGGRSEKGSRRVTLAPSGARLSWVEARSARARAIGQLETVSSGGNCRSRASGMTPVAGSVKSDERVGELVMLASHRKD